MQNVTINKPCSPMFGAFKHWVLMSASVNRIPHVIFYSPRKEMPWVNTPRVVALMPDNNAYQFRQIGIVI